MPAYGAEVDKYHGWYASTTNLNLRYAPTTSASKATTISRGTRVEVLSVNSNLWARVVYRGDTLFCKFTYLDFREPIEIVEPEPEVTQPAPKSGRSFWGWIWNIIWIVGALFLLRWLLLRVTTLIYVIAYKCYWVVCLPFYFLNWFQRYASKPWRLFFKFNGGDDSKNREYREIFEWVKVPLYILLTPLRAINAFYYNVVIYCSFEALNYIIEVLMPTLWREGADDTVRWLVMLPWRVGKYILWHGSLTLIESYIWTAVDTFVPALTLYHVTDCNASESITQDRGRVGNNGWYTGIWNVGGGNYAGNGIYFAPDRSTALHYSCGSLIVCRVTIGRVLDLGMAPKRIFDQCGHPNALGVTKWGLQQGYTTGEWWRADSRWWEYCMYDWQNRYNDSWRIRPLYVLSLDDEIFQRIPGGMHHWLFRQMVIDDLLTYFKGMFN